MHTKEPWEIFHYATRSLTGVCVPDPEGDGATIADFVDREDAERAVACVNACAGIKDPAAIRELVEVAQKCDNRLRHATQRLRLTHDPNYAVILEQAADSLAAAIAKVQG